MADYGRTTQGADDFNTGWCRGHPIPAGTLDSTHTVLKSVSIFVGATHGAQCRVAVYQGGTLGSPDSATLIRDFGQTSGSATDTVLTLTAGDETIDPGEVIWIVVKGNSTFATTADATSAGWDFDAATGRRVFTTPQGSDQTVAFTATLGATGTTGSFWYAMYITAEAPEDREQEGFRFREDDGSESAATWRQNQDVDDTTAKTAALRLRMLTNYTGNPPAEDVRLVVKRDDEDDTQWRTV